MTLDTPNPYKSPVVIDEPPVAAIAPRRASGALLIAWSIVFALNLPLPVYLGLAATTDHGRTGMVAAILVMYAVSMVACFFSPGRAWPILVGASIVAAFQIIFPIPQFAGGLLGVIFAAALGGAEAAFNSKITTEFGGFVATLVTGIVLLFAASLLALLLWCLDRLRRPSNTLGRDL